MKLAIDKISDSGHFVEIQILHLHYWIVLGDKLIPAKLRKFH